MTRFRLFHRRLQRLAWATGLVFIAAVMAAAPASAQSCAGGNLVQAAANALNQAANGHSPRAYAGVLDRYTNVSSLAMFALGPYRRALPATQRSEYVRLTRGYIGGMIADHARSLTGSKLLIQKCFRQGQYSYLDTSIGGRRVVWRVGGGRIIDVNVGGVWLAQQLRSSFVSVIRRGNGDVTALLQYLRGNSLAMR